MSARVDHRFDNNQSFYARLLYSDGEVDTPDRTVTPRRVQATQQPMNFVLNHQAMIGTDMINELRFGYNRPRYDALAFGPPDTTRCRSRCRARSTRRRLTRAARRVWRAAVCWFARRATRRPTARPTTRARFRWRTR